MGSKTEKQSIRLLVKLSSDRLRAAKKFASEEEYRDAVSRAYYAMFHIAKALLLSRGQTPTGHRGVSILFNQCFVKTKIIDKEFSKLIAEAREQREISDYEPEECPTQEEAIEVIKNAEKFIQKCKKNLIQEKYIKQ